MSAEQVRAARADPRCQSRSYYFLSSFAGSVVDDGTALPALTGATGDDLARAQATLRAGGVVVTDPRLVEGGRVTVEITTAIPNIANGGQQRINLPAYALTTGSGAPRDFYAPAAVTKAGLASGQWGFVAATRETPSVAQQDRLAAALRTLSPGLVPQVERGTGPPSSDDSRMALVLALAAGLITLGATSIATGLAAADGRADLSTLAAVGATPGFRRLLSLSQSGVIAGLGSLLGIAAGLSATFAILYAMNQAQARTWPAGEPFPLIVPWHTLAILVVVPLVAMLGAGLLTRSRLPIERRGD